MPLISPRLLALTALFALAHRGHAHYNLNQPLPYNPIDCNRPSCRGPCPPIWKSGGAKARNSPSNPSQTWSRGQWVNIEWHRNNHEGGFYRRSLVPVKHMNNAAWHKKTAFEWGCWTQNRYMCGRHPSCGTDKEGFAYRNKMRIPNVFPDGDYVFSMVWFGGIHWRRNRAHFSDYYTCAFVRIRGGALAQTHTPTFVPGRNHRSSVPPGQCVSTSQFAGECGGYECKQNKVRTGIAGVFSNGLRPPQVHLRDVQSAIGGHSRLPVGSQAQERRAIQQSKNEALRDAQMVNEEKRNGGLQQKKGTWWQRQQQEKRRREEAARKKRQAAAAQQRRNQLQQQKNRWQPKPKWQPRPQQSKPKWQPKPQENRWKPKPQWQSKPRQNQWQPKPQNQPKPKPRQNRWQPKQKQNKMCWKPVPPKAVGTWGPRYSQLWWRQRNIWWKRHAYCQQCRWKC